MKSTDIGGEIPNHFHRVVDCQWACPARTPVPEYLRLIAGGRYAESYALNWWFNVFPGILGRVCDRPCEPACRRGRVEKEPVAICRMKRVAADLKGDVSALLPKVSAAANGKRVVCVGAGPASLTVARDLALLGYQVTIFDNGKGAGGMVRTQIPKFRLPEAVIDEECGYIANLGVEMHFNHWVGSLRELLAESWDAVFVGTGAPRGRDAEIPGRQEAAAKIHIGIDWLAGIAFEHVKSVGKRVIVLGGGNTAMDCCRSARRLGAEEVKVVVRSGFDEMKASPWEREDALHEDISIHNYLVPLEFTHDNGRLTGVLFEKVRAEYDERGRRSLIPTGEPHEHMACDEVLVAIGQENSFPWIERDIGLEFDRWGMPVLDAATLQSTLPKVFFGGDAALGPKNIITAVAQGHEAAISIDLFCQGRDLHRRPPPHVGLASQRMGIHEWIYDNQVSVEIRRKVPVQSMAAVLKDINLELELGFDEKLAMTEAARCLNCDMATVFTPPQCIECDACIDICPSECITFTVNGPEADLRGRLKAPAPNTGQPLYVAEGL
ncbi:MAG: FAD-dependent oxidoreductase, partial [Desulfobulbus sp.]|nr:FAD-dependent oxidoreductase [Desulfobulbus sp.]